MGPPRTASGATCPAISPWVAPENRPSVRSATSSPRPSPTSAAVTASISRIPGPPAGPSLRMTTTSPGRMALAVTAAIASSSDSNTRAGPSCSRRSCPASLTTQPSGARFPRRMARPPVGLSGSSSGRTTRWPSASRVSRACSPIVRPVTVGASSWSRPASSRRCATTPTPPALNRSTATYCPPGLRSHTSGVREAIRSKSSMSRSTPASRATASRCSTALVEPPLAATAAIAFSSDSRLMTSLGRCPRARTSITSRPHS